MFIYEVWWHHHGMQTEAIWPLFKTDLNPKLQLAIISWVIFYSDNVDQNRNNNGARIPRPLNGKLSETMFGQNLPSAPGPVITISNKKKKQIRKEKNPGFLLVETVLTKIMFETRHQRNPRGGAKERVNRLIQKFDKSAYIVMEIFVVYYDVLKNENIISSHF